MLFHQLHAVDGHAPVHRFAHVVNGEQSDLYCSQSFHFDAGLAVGFHGGRAADAGIFKVICATSRWVGWTKFGQENLPKAKFTLADRLKSILSPLLDGTITPKEKLILRAVFIAL